jgi:drug/metabolite transporter (DMT)-like permease
VNPRERAFALALTAASLWGLSGTAAQALFQHFGFPAPALVSIRMLASGAILWAIVRPTRPRSDPLGFLAFAVVGLFGVQITFFLAIAYSNAATTTLLQSLSLPIMASVEAARGGGGRSPRLLVAVALALAGTTTLILGRPGLGLAVTPLGLVFGLLSAVTAAFYILASRPFIARHGAWPVTTWGLLIGGLASLPTGLASLWGYAPPTSPASVAAVVGLGAFVVVFGTLVAFGLFFWSLGRIRATEAGVAATMEPISAALAALVFLGVLLTPWQYLGGAVVLVAVYLIASTPVDPGPPNGGPGLRRTARAASGGPER